MLINGREMIMTKTNARPYTAFGDDHRDYKHTSFARDARIGKVEETPVSSIFYSSHNIHILQEGIRYRVFRESGGRYTIDRQSDVDLQQIMHGIFQENARHRPDDVVRQVRALNGAVLDYTVPRILTEIESYLKYRVDVTTLPLPLERSPNTSVKGTKTLEMRGF
jgi:hypothetical protein